MNKQRFYHIIGSGSLLLCFACLPFLSFAQKAETHAQYRIHPTPIIYPNPTMNKIKFKGLKGEVLLLNVVNELGKTVYSGEASETEEFNMAHFPKGTYFFRFSNGNQSFYSNVVKD